jgi:hypothetical protein
MPDRQTAVLTGPDRIARIGAKKPQRMLLTGQLKIFVGFFYRAGPGPFLAQMCVAGDQLIVLTHFLAWPNRTTIVSPLMSPDLNVGGNYTVFEI